MNTKQAKRSRSDVSVKTSEALTKWCFCENKRSAHEVMFPWNNLSVEKVFQDIDFKELAKTYKTQDDLASLTKQFMKNSEKGNLWLNVIR